MDRTSAGGGRHSARETERSPGARPRNTRWSTGPAPRAVLLDASGTLIEVARPPGETYSLLARDFGGDLDPDTLTAGFRSAFADAPPMAFPGKHGADLDRAERGWWRAVVERVIGAAGGVPELDACFDRLYAHYASAQAWRIYPEVPAVLASLRGRGIALAVVSNFDSRLPPLLDGLGLSAFFDAVVCSGEVGAAKPDGAIFAHALAILGVEASEALHVGDDPEADYEGARAAGLKALLVDRGAAANHAGVIADLGGILERYRGRRTQPDGRRGRRPRGSGWVPDP